MYYFVKKLYFNIIFCKVCKCGILIKILFKQVLNTKILIWWVGQPFFIEKRENSK